MIAAAEAEINEAAQEVITPSPSISNSTTVTTTSPTPRSNASELSTTEQYSSEQYSYPSMSLGTATLTSAVLGGATPTGPFLLPGDEYYLQNVYHTGFPQQLYHQMTTPLLESNSMNGATEGEEYHHRASEHLGSQHKEKGGRSSRYHRKGHISLVESQSDQASDIAPLDLSPDGGSEDVSTGTPSTRSALSSDSEISRSDLSDSDEEDRATIRRRIVVDKNNNTNNSNAPQKMPSAMDTNMGSNYKLKTSKNSKNAFF